MGFYKQLLRPILFRLDPETAHSLAMRALRFVPGVQVHDPILRQDLFGRTFPNPIGLAAGLDKDGEHVGDWERLGFGFVEVGTVTPRPQVGNPRPRLFRLPADQALINRMGFNNQGAEALGNRLRGTKVTIPIGVNIGKQKETPLDNAPEDYAECVRLLDFAPAYFAINVSSPNTPGLRELQDASLLADIIDAVRAVTKAPLFVKIAPDLTWEQIDAVITLAMDKKLQGIIATNTTIARDGLVTPIAEEGGLSGRPLRSRSTEVIRHIRAASKDLTLIGVGGVSSPEEALEKLLAGASLVQLYTGIVYEGPELPASIAKGLAALLRARGFTSVVQAIGSDVQ